MNEQNELQNTLIVDDSTQALINSCLEQVFNEEPSQMVTAAETLLHSLNMDLLHESYELVKLTLESAWKYAYALNGILAGTLDWAQVSELFRQAATGFEYLGQEHLRDLAIGMSVYVQAVVELRNLNVKLAIDHLHAVEDYFEKAGEYSRKFKPLIDHIKPEMLFVSSIPAIQQLDFATARTLVEDASSSANYVAATYYEDEQPQKLFFQGCAHFYRSFYQLFRSYNDLQQFEYDRLAQDVELVEEAKTARNLLVTAKEISEPARILADLSEALVPLEEVIYSMSHVMKKVFEATFTPKLVELYELRRKLQVAGECAAKAGPQAIVLVRFCEQLTNQIKNLERLARPTKKDFGIYSGLVTAGIFAVLLLTTSWANSAFQLGLGPEKLITANMTLALIAGFGFGAVKFKGLLFSFQKGDGNSG